jgi:hypothetical protein
VAHSGTSGLTLGVSVVVDECCCTYRHLHFGVLSMCACSQDAGVAPSTASQQTCICMLIKNMMVAKLPEETLNKAMVL